MAKVTGMIRAVSHIIYIYRGNFIICLALGLFGSLIGVIQAYSASDIRSQGIIGIIRLYSDHQAYSASDSKSRGAIEIIRLMRVCCLS